LLHPDLDLSTRADGRDVPPLDHDDGITQRRSARAINQRSIDERHHLIARRRDWRCRQNGGPWEQLSARLATRAKHDG